MVLAETSRPSVREIVRRFEAADDEQKREKSAQKVAKKRNAKIPCQEERISIPSHTVKGNLVFSVGEVLRMSIDGCP